MRPGFQKTGRDKWRAVSHAAANIASLKKSLKHRHPDGRWIPCRGTHVSELCHEPTVWADMEFPQCPWLCLADPVWQVIVRELNATLVAPLQDWPDGYSAFMFDGMSEARAAEGSRTQG